jgi:hypothetical protein
MTTKPTTAGDFFIVDNSEEHWKALQYLKQWCDISESVDIATGYFEVGALLALDGEWQKVDKFRILIGSETSRPTVEAIRQAKEVLDKSLAREIVDDPFLTGLNGVIEAIRSGRIEIRVYRTKKFHAKAYITHGRLDVVGSAALVGSSNFTPAGLTRNVELNVRFTGVEVRELQEWFESYWEDGEDVQAELLTIMDRFDRQYTPFEIYAKALSTLTKDIEPSASEWERESSVMYPILAPYQREAYHGLKQRAAQWRGAFLTDGVGLGKTFVGLMLAEYFAVKERRKVLILATKTGVDAVWNPELQKYLKHLTGAFASVEIMAHTDLSKADALDVVGQMAERVDVIIIDEAHNFRNRGSQGDDPLAPKSRWWRLQEMAKGKLVFNLTATPINNTLFDFVHQCEIFTGMAEAHFASLGIPNVRNYVLNLENTFHQVIQGNVDLSFFEDLMVQDKLLQSLVIQNSRQYAVKSAIAAGKGDVKFPEPAMPRAVPYDYTVAFGTLLSDLEIAFQSQNPLFVLPMYYPLAFSRDPQVNTQAANRQAQVVSLIRTTFLKRFESSIAAFAGSSADLARKIADWIIRYSQDKPSHLARIQEWVTANSSLIEEIHEAFRPGVEFEEFEMDYEDLGDQDDFDGQLPDEEVLTDEAYKLDEMLDAAFDDLDQLTSFLSKATAVGHVSDGKFLELLALVKGGPLAKGKKPEVFLPEITQQKVLIFTEFADTARYLEKQLRDNGVEHVDRIDGSRKKSRLEMVKRFAPHYNGVSEDERLALAPLRVLVSTDVLSEGVNLQDGTIIVNYDIHWNPVRLMQRIGRVDRRLNLDIESNIVAENPKFKASRGIVTIRNFLPPDQLNLLLSLYNRVQGRVIRISKTLGIPGGRLLNEEDLLDDVKVYQSFLDDYNGNLSPVEALRLRYLDLVTQNPGLDELVDKMPNGVHASKSSEPRGIFECSIEPIRTAPTDDSPAVWTLDEGTVRWEFIDADGKSVTDVAKIDEIINSSTQTVGVEVSDRIAVRAQLAKRRTNRLAHLQKHNELPLGAVGPLNVCWMEIQ